MADAKYAGPEEYQFGTDSVPQLADFVVRELRRIGQAMYPGIFPDFIQLTTLNAEPDKPREGMVVLADGTDWNPGSGAGVYGYIGGLWVSLSGGGAGAAPVGATYLCVSLNGVLTAERNVAAGAGITFVDAGANSSFTIGADVLQNIPKPTGTVDFNGQQASNFRIENRTSDPGAPSVGQIWIRTDL